MIQEIVGMLPVKVNPVTEDQYQRNMTRPKIPPPLFQTTLEWYHRITSGQSVYSPKAVKVEG